MEGRENEGSGHADRRWSAEMRDSHPCGAVAAQETPSAAAPSTTSTWRAQIRGSRRGQTEIDTHLTAPGRRGLDERHLWVAPLAARRGTVCPLAHAQTAPHGAECLSAPLIAHSSVLWCRPRVSPTSHKAQLGLSLASLGMEAALPKKFINDPSEVVGDMLDGLCAMNGDVVRLRPYNVRIFRHSRSLAPT